MRCEVNSEGDGSGAGQVSGTGKGLGTREGKRAGAGEGEEEALRLDEIFGAGGRCAEEKEKVEENEETGRWGEVEGTKNMQVREGEPGLREGVGDRGRGREATVAGVEIEEGESEPQGEVNGADRAGKEDGEGGLPVRFVQGRRFPSSFLMQPKPTSGTSPSTSSVPGAMEDMGVAAGALGQELQGSMVFSPGPSMRRARKDLSIDVNAEVKDEDRPALPLEWGVEGRSLLFESPFSPTMYDEAGSAAEVDKLSLEMGNEPNHKGQDVHNACGGGGAGSGMMEAIHRSIAESEVKPEESGDIGRCNNPEAKAMADLCPDPNLPSAGCSDFSSAVVNTESNVGGQGGSTCALDQAFAATVTLTMGDRQASPEIARDLWAGKKEEEGGEAERVQGESEGSEGETPVSVEPGEPLMKGGEEQEGETSGGEDTHAENGEVKGDNSGGEPAVSVERGESQMKGGEEEKEGGTGGTEENIRAEMAQAKGKDSGGNPAFSLDPGEPRTMREEEQEEEAVGIREKEVHESDISVSASAVELQAVDENRGGEEEQRLEDRACSTTVGVDDETTEALRIANNALGAAADALGVATTALGAAVSGVAAAVTTAAATKTSSPDTSVLSRKDSGVGPASLSTLPVTAPDEALQPPSVSSLRAPAGGSLHLEEGEVTAGTPRTGGESLGVTKESPPEVASQDKSGFLVATGMERGQGVIGEERDGQDRQEEGMPELLNVENIPSDGAGNILGTVDPYQDFDAAHDAAHVSTTPQAPPGRPQGGLNHLFRLCCAGNDNRGGTNPNQLLRLCKKGNNSMESTGQPATQG
ncbi:unnamed protein product [Discosporangium mesarthrocarpum]